MNRGRWKRRAIKVATDAGYKSDTVLPTPKDGSESLKELWMRPSIAKSAAACVALLIKGGKFADGNLDEILKEPPSFKQLQHICLVAGIGGVFGAEEKVESDMTVFFIDPDASTALNLLEHIFLSVDTPGELQHPWDPLIEGWLKRPMPSEPDSRSTGIAPAPLGRMGATAWMRSDDSAVGTLFDLSEFEAAPDFQGLIQSHLPGFRPAPSAVVTPLPFLIWDRNGKEERGRGAPYGLRLWIEYVVSVPVADRDHARTISHFWGEIVDNSLGRRGDRRAQERILMALQDVHTLRMVYGKPGGLTGRSVVMVQDKPLAWNQYDAAVRAIVELPPGSGSGPVVYKPFLREIGRQSAPGYRAALSLCYFWDRYGATGGKYIQALRPRLARNSDGLLIGENGEVLLKKDDTPRRRYMIGKGNSRRLHPDVVALDERGQRVHSVAQAAKEDNPAMELYPILSDDDLVQMCYPYNPALSASARSNRKDRARSVMQMLADKGYVIIREVDGGVRILPPSGWGAGYAG